MTYETSGRNARLIGVLVVIYLLIAAALIFLDAAPWIMWGIAAMTLPALWDIWVDRAAGVSLDATHLAWHSGDVSDAIELSGIEYARFDTRMDFSVKVTLVLVDGRKIRLPYDCLPPHRVFEAAMVELGLRTERHHFGQL